MLKMGTNDGGRPDHQDSQTDTAIGSSSGTGSDQAYMEHFSDVPDHCVAVDSVQTADGGKKNDPDQVTSMAKMAPEMRSSFGSSIIRSASSSIKRKLKRLPAHRIDRSKSGVAQALKGLKFISETEVRSRWEAVEKRFNHLAVHGSLSRADFGECIGMEKSKEFAGELFDALARKRKRLAKLVPNSSKKEELKKSNSSAKEELKELNSITKEELEVYWKQISDPSFDSRLQTFLDMVDKDEDGRITKEELKQIISLSASANKLSKIQEHAEEYAQLIVEALDPDNLGYIRVENLEIILLEAPQLYSMEEEGKSNSRKLTQMLSQKLKPSKERNPIRRWYQKSKYLLQDNWPRIWIFGLWIGIVSGLFLYRFLQYRNKAVFDVMGCCVCIAKGAAETLKFNMAVMLLPVCRNTITWLRNNTKLGVAIPFDDNINFHMVIAVGIAVGVVLHGGAHMGCDFPRILHATEDEYEPMKPLLGEKQPTRYWWFVKGMEGWTGIVMVVLMAVAFTLAPPLFRRNKLKLPKLLQKLTGFNAFWYSHHLFVIVYALLIVHGIEVYLIKEWYKKTTWMYLAFPVLLYACERLIRAFRSGIKPVAIQKGLLHPGNVLALHMSKPQGFKYKSGQYMFVNCAAVSPFEWHPFSITSAPGDDYLSVHISKQGDWTGQLQTVFCKVCQAPTSVKSSFPKLLIDGPYGAPAQEYKEYEVVLLVGLGIGATPFISVVKDIINNRKAMENEVTELERGDQVGCLGPKENEVFKTRHAYFYWVTREQCSFEWFKDVINEVASLDERGTIELHNYCTSVYEEGDARSALIGMLQSLYHAKNGVDVVSGTSVKSHFGKPNWRNVYNGVALTHKYSRIGVFYCGPTGPIKMLRQLALDFSRDPNFETIFDFHKENF